MSSAAAVIPAAIVRTGETLRRLSLPSSLGPALGIGLALVTMPALAAQGSGALEEVVVIGRSQSLLGLTSSASQGVIGAADLAQRPILRSGELLEVIPGAAVTQHSGTGKANQYFLRGFNLDHGTDFAAFLDGVPLNLPTHGHGQGYLDLNPIIPELVDQIAFGKGPYYADVGDFSSAGYARYSLADELDGPFLKFTGGEYDFYRLVGGASTKAGPGVVLAGIETQWYDGPWELDEDARKLNVLAKFSPDSGSGLPGFSFMLYDAEWQSTDQVPRRAIRNGLISRRGNIDPTLGGHTTRYSANVEYGEADARGLRANAWATYSDFALYSNFTYLLDDPINGDQITQRDARITTGFNGAYSTDLEVFGRPASWELGTQIRHDRIRELALLQSRARRFVSGVRDDEADITSAGVYFRGELNLGYGWRTEIGLRADRYWFDTDSDTPANSGSARDFLVSPKFALIYRPWRNTEWFVNVGQGFHSNDARGTVARIDPVSGDPAFPVDPLVRSTGLETGLRGTYFGRLNSSLSVWALELDSELVFVGDAGSTEPSGESRRYGIEIANYYRVNDWLILDLDLAFTHAEFLDVGADEIPNSVGRVITAGATVDFPVGLFGALRLRHFGDSPLTEDGMIEAGSTTVVNLRGGYRFGKHLELTLDVFNLLGSSDPDISYFYESCIAGDPAALCGAGLAERDGVSDVHLHPVEPRALRASLTYRF